MRLKQRRFVKQGYTRFVILIPGLGIAIKIAKINVFKGLDKLIAYPITATLRTKSIKKGWVRFYRQLTWSSGVLDTAGYYWLRGINANWQEFRFYLKTRHPLLQSTYFSFFGLFNIQKIGSIPLKPNIERQFYSISAGRASGHHFENPDNFCLQDGKLKFLDYGDENPRLIILEYGDMISQQFDPDWDYEQYKKRRAEKLSSKRIADA